MKYALVEKQINLPNYRLSYLEGGNPFSLSTILFLHGWSISIEPYQNNLNKLAERHRIIAPYLPGFSKSTTPKLLQSYNDYAQCILEFVKVLELKQLHLIGHSLGGAIGILLAASNPSLVSSLTLVDSTGIPLGSLPEVLLRRSVEMTAEVVEMKLDVVSKMVQNFVYNCLFNPQNVIQSAWICLEEDVRPFLPKIKAPTLVLWGKNDQFTPLHIGQEFAQGIKNSRLIVLEGEYHEWSLFKPETFVALVFDFLEKIESQ